MKTPKDPHLDVLKKIEKNTAKIVALMESSISLHEMNAPVSQKSWATIIDTPEKKTSELLAECKTLFPVWSYYSDEQLDTLCPAPKKTVTKVFKESIEPDCLGMSYDDAIEKGISFMSARERIILELHYFKETGKGLDIKGWTITSTLDSDGDAMRMYRNDDGRFSVGGAYRDGRDSVDGPRQQLPL